MDKKDQQLANESITESTAIVNFETMSVDAGTEEMDRQDLNTPTLRLIQGLSDTGLPNPQIGWFYRSDTNEQIQNPEVDFVYVTTSEQLNWKKTGMETVKIYYGFYHGTKEPFKMFVRGWSLGGHRNFQTEVAMIKGKYHIPMLGLRVTLGSQDVSGNAQDGTPYKTKAITFMVNKAENGKPTQDTTVERADFLYNSIQSFKQSAMASEAHESENDVTQNQ